MKVQTLTQDINRIKTLIELGNIKAIKAMVEKFTHFYISTIYSRLDPFEQKKWEDMNL